MNSIKPSCPCCSHQLLRHIRQQKITWYCCNCRQEMPNFASDRPHLAAKSSVNQIITKNISNAALIAG